MESVKTLTKPFKSLETRFNPLQHRSLARSYLKKLSTGGIKKEKERGLLEALGIAHERVINTVPRCGRDYQSDNHYCGFLEDTVRNEEWAKKVIQDRLKPSPTGQTDYNTFYSKLGAALTSYKRHHPFKTDDFVTSKTQEAAVTFYGEGYAVPFSKRKTSFSTQRGRTPYRNQHRSSGNLNVSSMLCPPNRIEGKMKHAQLSQLKARTRCLRCNKLGYWRHEFPERSSPSKAVLMSLVQELDNNDLAVAQTL